MPVGTSRDGLSSSRSGAPDFCIAGQPNCGHPTPPPTPTPTRVSSFYKLRATNYSGNVATLSNGVKAKAIDSSGAVTNSVLSPGVSLTHNGYGLSPLVITASHPMFASPPQAFKVGTTTFSPVAGLPMWRFTDPTYGSGAAWITGPWTNMSLVMTFTGFQTFTQMRAPVPMPMPTPNPNQSPPPNVQLTCQQQAAATAAGSFWVGLFGTGLGAAAMIPSPATPWLGAGSVLSGLVSAQMYQASGSPCPAQPPNPQPGQDTWDANQLIPGGLQVLSGNPGWPDGSGGGSNGTDPNFMVC